MCSNEKKIWMTFFILMCISFFKISIPCDFFKINCHLLILNGHGPYVTLYAIKHAQDFNFNIITLPFHTSHAFQPLTLSWFKPFKFALQKERGKAMAKKNYMEPNNFTLIRQQIMHQTNHSQKPTSNYDLRFMEYVFLTLK